MRPRVILPHAAIAVLASVLLGAGLAILPASAHEVRPAYLQIEEDTPGEFNVLFKTPMRRRRPPRLSVAFSDQVEAITPVVSRMTGDAMIQTWRIRAIDAARGAVDPRDRRPQERR